VSVTHGKLEGRITVPSGVTIAIVDSGGAATCAITAGDYYLSTPGSGVNELIFQLQVDLTSSGAGDVWAVSIDAGEDGSGKVTIDDTQMHSGGGWSITWTSTVLRDILGFAGDISGSTTAQTGSNHAKYLWIPDCPIISPYGAGDDGTSETDARTVESPAGHVSVLYSQRKTVLELSWEALSHAKTRIAGESTTGESFEQFFADVILGEDRWATVPGGPIRVHWDAADDATYTTYAAAGEIAKGFRPEQVQQGWIGLWKHRLDRLVKVPS